MELFPLGGVEVGAAALQAGGVAGHQGDRRAQFMAHRIHEGPLPLPGHRQAIQQVVEGAGDPLQLAGLGGQGQALIAKGFGFDLLHAVAEVLQGPESGLQHRPQQGAAHQGGESGKHQQQQGVALLPADVEGHILKQMQGHSGLLGPHGHGAREIAVALIEPGARHHPAALLAPHQGQRGQAMAAIHGAGQGLGASGGLDPGVHADQGRMGGQGSLLLHPGQQLAGHLPVGFAAVELRQPAIGQQQHPIARQHRDQAARQQPLPQGAMGAGQQGYGQAQRVLVST